MKINDTNLHYSFSNSVSEHILMITNHGLHQWNIIPGLPDTGGQNIFVNLFSKSLVNFGYKITIVNRGGYAHPISGEMHEGIHYLNDDLRIVYIEDSKKEFVRKEDMDHNLPQLADNLFSFLSTDSAAIDLIISHYWDGAELGRLINHKLSKRVKHIWVPHSLGPIKKSNVKPERWAELRIDTRIDFERNILKEIDYVGTTSDAITKCLTEYFNNSDNLIFLPPCVDTDVFYHRDCHDDKLWNYLAEHSTLSKESLKKHKIITEISRTDTTKRKDVLIKAFAKVLKKHPDTILVLTLDSHNNSIGQDLEKLIQDEGVSDKVIKVGNVLSMLPALYSITDIYCSPSIMEGFGMAVQEAAATKVPVVGSNLIPFVKEFLQGKASLPVQTEGNGTVQVGEGSIMVEADDIEGFCAAITYLLDNDSLRKSMGNRAFEITIPYFTWFKRTSAFLNLATGKGKIEEETALENGILIPVTN